MVNPFSCFVFLIPRSLEAYYGLQCRVALRQMSVFCLASDGFLAGSTVCGEESFGPLQGKRGICEGKNWKVETENLVTAGWWRIRYASFRGAGVNFGGRVILCCIL